MAKVSVANRPAIRIPTGSGRMAGIAGAGDVRTPYIGGPASSNPSIPQMSIVVVDPLKETGSSGIRRARGIMLEETLRELRGRFGVRAYREVYDNSTVIAGALLLYKLILRQVKQQVLPRVSDDPSVPTDPLAFQLADFCAGVLEDMEHRVDDTFSEIYTILIYGWAYLEETNKYRLGYSPGYEMNPNDPEKILLDRYGNPVMIPQSKFNDGKVGIQSLNLRAQDTLQEWKLDEHGRILGMLQNDPWSGVAQMKFIPIEKALHFRTESIKNNPEGRSLLRPSWPTWRQLKRILEAEAVGVTRDITGIPKITVPASAMVQNPEGDAANTRATAERVGTSLAMHEEAMILIPALFDKNHNKLFDVELMSTNGTRLWDTSAIAGRLEARMLTSVLMQFMLLGQDKSGSWALSTNQSDATIMAINAIAQSAADVFTDVCFPRLVRMNGWDPSMAPMMKPDQVKRLPDLKEMADYLKSLGTMGVGLVEPGSPLENALLMFAGLPTTIPSVSSGDETIQNPEDVKAEQAPGEPEQTQPAQTVDPNKPAQPRTPAATPPGANRQAMAPTKATARAQTTQPKATAPPPRTGRNRQV